MFDNTKKYLEYLLRGYGQLFLCNRVSSGILFLTAMFLISPRAALLSLAGAAAATGAAWIFCRRTALLKSGLFGVNGVLLGYFWILFPEAPFWIAAAGSITGSIIVAAILAPVMSFLHRKESPITLFSLPAVMIFWLLLGLMWSGEISDPDMNRGWIHFFKGSLSEAEKCFTAAELTHNKAKAFREDGLGWIAFKTGKYKKAAEHFNRAIQFDSSLNDPYDGAGWSYLKTGNYLIAKEHFRKSLNIDPFKSSSLDGLGWVQYLLGNIPEAKSNFQKAAFITPLFFDPWTGLSLCAKAEGKDAGGYLKIQNYLERFKGSPSMFSTIFHFAGWILFLAGVILHSRISGIVVISVLLFSVLLQMIPGLDHSIDINYYYNIAALAIALGGAYITMSRTAVFILALNVIVLYAGWPWFETFLLPVGLPVLCLPFNIMLLVNLGILSIMKGKLGVHLVPLEIATTTPENVLWWKRKKQLVEVCREYINIEREKLK